MSIDQAKYNYFQHTIRAVNPPFKPAAKWCSDQGEMAGVSGGIGATNACTRMYRLGARVG